MAKIKEKIPKIIFSGIQPTGIPTLGNYIGAIKPWVRLQNQYPDARRFYTVVDLHALTNRFTQRNQGKKGDDEVDIGDETLEMALSLIACGIDHNKSTLFVQSQVPQHAELTWLLSCIAPHNWLNTMIQYKEKKQKGSSLGLYSYPVLMSADILLYKADYVPVGEDQVQHIELARNYAERFNSLFGKNMVIPEASVSKVPRVMSLTDGTKKMSKSDKKERSRINLTDTMDQIEEKIMKAKTDSIEGISYDPRNRREVTNLINIYSELEDVGVEVVVHQFAGKSIKNFKEELVEVVIKNICPIGDSIIELRQELDLIEKVLVKGQNEAFDEAEKNLLEFKDIMNLLV